MDNYETGPADLRGRNTKEILEIQVNPFVDVLLKLSTTANNFACTANHVSNVNATESHEIKELLDLAFDVRKCAEKLFDALEDSCDDLIKSIKDCK